MTLEETRVVADTASQGRLFYLVLVQGQLPELGPMFRQVIPDVMDLSRVCCAWSRWCKQVLLS